MLLTRPSHAQALCRHLLTKRVDQCLTGQRAPERCGQHPPSFQLLVPYVLTSWRHVSSVPPGGSGQVGHDKGTPQNSEAALQENGVQGGRRRRVWERSLSPLERISRLLPQDSLTEDILHLRAKPREEQSDQEGSLTSDAHATKPTGAADSSEPRDPSSREVPFKPGDLVLAEFRMKHRVEFRKMFSLSLEGKLHSNWGLVHHQDIVGRLPGQVLRTSTGVRFLMRRPALDEFVLLMKRGPTISYPKDVNAMLMMMDVSEGDWVLETGSGSGAMTLFLSRAVGSRGRVVSFEVRSDHHDRAARNFQRWRSAWQVAHREEWPDNVAFINKDVSSAASDISEVTFDSVALDMLNPQVALPVVHRHLKQGAVCAVYLANITQVVDLLEGVRHYQLPFFCEKVTEVTHRHWLVAPVLRKDGSNAPRVPPAGVRGQEDEPGSKGQDQPEDPTDQEDGLLETVMDRPFGTVPYVARPHHEQGGHTAFLVKLRKFLSVPHLSQTHDC
ncbi:tRNA (adenine(58)-N(1))-methyltransferase, mitochondrial isoform X2 [Acipenser oxyrinchus oxyrinchus]|uniref:tRNA (adenine(58)-N(1))-methyltransferase n=1 Tax=Acipenser oxyrinchus oxyrinchus TaxID=40147 RepID=A0AAD8GBA9_ACIOX|nr:tRNA (adenine(58)-N(1))-methyltransferase, mitochondrial isoform X2 [Acipenser oxyrinchus oxyrinchus]